MCCKEQEKLSESNYRTQNAKNHVKGGQYLPETPKRTHGGEVRWVGAIGQRLVLREVGPGPTCNIPEIRCEKIAKILNFLAELEYDQILN
jgi:hypothetical protein